MGATAAWQLVPPTTILNSANMERVVQVERFTLIAEHKIARNWKVTCHHQTSLAAALSSHSYEDENVRHSYKGKNTNHSYFYMNAFVCASGAFGRIVRACICADGDGLSD